MVLAVTPTEGTVATVFAVMSFGDTFMIDATEDDLEMAGRGRRRVLLRTVTAREGVFHARVEPYEPPASTVAPERLARLQELFARYADTDAGYHCVPQYRFYAERVAALDDPRAIGWSIAHVLDLAPDAQYDLLTATDTTLINRLIALFDEREAE